MTRDRIIDFLQQSSYMLRNIAQAGEKLNEAKAGKALLEAQGETEHVLKIAAHIVSLQGQLTKLEDALKSKSRRDTIEGCETLLKDVNERMKLADQSHDRWRALIAQMDVELRAGTLSGDERAATEKSISEAEKVYESCIEAASDMVPSPGLVLL